MLASNDQPQPSTTVDLLTRLGAQLVPSDRVVGYVFGTGRWFGSCPKCHRWDSIHVEGESWRAACACFGRPWHRLDRIDALIAIMKIEAAA